MKDEFINRLDMFSRSLGVLDMAEHKPIWQNKPPIILTTKIGEARVMTNALQEAEKKQEKGTGGMTDEKDREETELEDAALTLASALVLYYNDHGQETEAGEVDLTPSEWRGLRDQQLLAKSQLVIDGAAALATGATAEEAAKYGITPEAVEALTKERKDYDDIVNAPGVAIAVRTALTKGFREAFNLTEAKFAEVDKLTLQLRKTDKGRALVAAWKAAREIKGPGSGSSAGGTGGNPPQG
jgi:hypothetical protein